MPASPTPPSPSSCGACSRCTSGRSPRCRRWRWCCTARCGRWSSCLACWRCCAASAGCAIWPRSHGVWALFAISALLLSCNWLLYVFAVQSGHVVEASLGYFINPIVNVLLGVLVLHERLRRVQWAAVALAAAGVLWLTVLARPAALDRAGAGTELRPLRPAAQDRLAGRAGRPGAGDDAARAGGRAALAWWTLARQRCHGRRATRRSTPGWCSAGR